MEAAAEEERMQGQRAGKEKILVSVRLRPLNEKEISRNDVSDWECINDDTLIYRNNLSVSERSMYPSAYTFDRVFRPDCSTRQVYEEGAKEVALSVVRGINSSVFAYGQTSSGKTYTMDGVTEYTVADIYDYVQKHKERQFILKLSAMEIYNESVRDLLSSDTTPLRLLDDPERGTVVERLTEETLRDWDHFVELLSVCAAERQIGETSLNETSSRSHQILRLTVESSAHEFLGSEKSSALAATVNFVDLAGSERASQTSSAGMRLKEGCHINRSLLTLGTVIRKLSKGRNGHVPFRDSKLTRILHSSLGGNSRTAIICTVSPARTLVEQSRNTLMFASCAKEVTTNAQINIFMSDKALIKQLQRELSRLESELRSTPPDCVTSHSIAIMREKDLEIEKLKMEVSELSQQLDIAQSRVNNLLQAAGDNRASTPWADLDCHYPSSRGQNSCRYDSASYSVISEDQHCQDIGVRSLDASQCSDRHSGSISDANFISLSEFEGNFSRKKSSPELPICTSNFVGEGLHKTREQTIENSDTICKEVQCIKVEESSPNSYAHANMSKSGQHRSAVSNMSSPTTEMGTSKLTESRSGDRVNPEIHTYAMNEKRFLNGLLSDFVLPSLKEPSPWLLEDGVSRLKLFRSRSCRARLDNNFATCLVEKNKENENTPPSGTEKEFPGRPEVCRLKLFALKYDLDTERLSKKGSRNPMGCSTADDLNIKGNETLMNQKSTGARNSDATIKHTADHLEQETTEQGNVYAKNVKDVGLDPIQDHSDAAPKWPSEFKRIQQNIIELWHVCNISLVHRTYFFLLFRGDPSDSFYMEVEHRRLSFLRDTFSKGNEHLLDGRILTPTSSKRALDEERQMLRTQMKKRFSREERENLFLKWGVSLSASNRRLRLVRVLWTETTDIDRISESAALVAKLVGFNEQEQALKEMFGLLNFTPTSPLKKKPSFWKRNLSVM